MIDKINFHLSNFDLDIRKSRNARFMDQKVTPDILCLISDCVINFLAKDISKEFTVKDIWNSNYFDTSVTQIFNKPAVLNKSAKSEYDKFIQQPLKALEYANILCLKKSGNTNIYSVKNYEILEFLSMKDRNSYIFLYNYLIKVLSDSGLLIYFEDYQDKFHEEKLTKSDFVELKCRFERFLIGNTPINTKVEARRIFPKIMNIFAAENCIPGTERGRMSNYTFYYTDLMYNRINWRDTTKDKNLTRQEADKKFSQYLSQNDCYSESQNEYLINKAISLIKKIHPFSEIKNIGNQRTVQVHHIFPRNEFPQLASVLENLIGLTVEQHLNQAHPNNNTHIIDVDYQQICLLAKADSIQKSIKKGEFYYSKKLFLDVINTGLDAQLPEEFTFSKIKKSIVNIYNNL